MGERGFFLKGGERGVCHDLSEFIHLRWKKGLCVVVLLSVCFDRGNFVVDGTRIRKIIILLGLAICPMSVFLALCGIT